MSNQVTRKDIDEVIGIIKDFMAQSSLEFEAFKEKIDDIDRKYDHLVNTIDGFISRIDKYEWKVRLGLLNLKDCYLGHANYR